MVNKNKLKKRPQSVNGARLTKAKQNLQLDIFNDYITDLIKTKHKTCKQGNINCAKIQSCSNMKTQKY